MYNKNNVMFGISAVIRLSLPLKPRPQFLQRPFFDP